MKIKKGDIVLITKGKDKGKDGKVLRVFPKRERLLVEGVNLKKKHVRPQGKKEKGEVVNVPGSIHVSNVKIICSKCKQPTKIGYKTEKNKKKRICKKCGKEI